MKTMKVLELPENSFIIEEEYGFKHHIWIDTDNKFDKNFNFAGLNWVHQIKRKFGGTIIKNVHILFRSNSDEEWVSFSGLNFMPVEFDGKVVAVEEDEDGNPSKAYNGTNLKWIGIDLE